jgi:hypothetical protein
MFGAGELRAARYRNKCDYSHAVLERFIRIKKLTILNHEDSDQLYKVVFSKRRPGWHNFRHLLRTFAFVPMRENGMIYSAYVGGVRIRKLSVEQADQIAKLRAVGAKIDKIVPLMSKA